VGNVYQNETARRVADEAIRAGYRAFIAKRGHYGIITDTEGTRVVSFQVDLCSVDFGGNYVTSAPQRTGTGWQILRHGTGSAAEIHRAMREDPPAWALCGAAARLTTLEEHLKMYDSSGYAEVRYPAGEDES